MNNTPSDTTADDQTAAGREVFERTGLEVLSNDECWRLIGGSEVGRLAVSIANQPDIFPINYAVDGETIVITTDAGTKLAAAVLGSAVAFEVDSLDADRHTGWSIVVHGKAHEVEGVEETLEAEDLGIKTWAERDKSRFIRIVPSEVTGRRIPGHG